MPFPISRVAGAPRFDSLPVAVIKHYPLEKRDYKPYAQCILCVNEEHLFLRMWAFETSPLPESQLRGVLYLFPQNPATALLVTLQADESAGCALLRQGMEAPAPGSGADSFTSEPFSGEDLQGIYWGGTVKLRRDFLQELAGEPALNPGDSFKGNLFKLCQGEPFVHKGSFFAADFSDPYALSSMGDFTVTAY